MGRKRTIKQNKGLPERWRWKHGAIYYQVPKSARAKWDNKTEFRLGKTVSEAYRTWAEKVEVSENIKTVGELLDRYILEIIPGRAVSSQPDLLSYSKNLKAVFGHFHLSDIEPQHIYQYVEKRRKKVVGEDGKTRGGLSIAKREIAMFSDSYTKAVKWGLIKSHPFKGQVILEGEKPRDRYIENWELECFFSLKPFNRIDTTRTIQAYSLLKIITGLRRQDLLTLKLSQFKDKGIDVTPLKTQNSSGKRIIIEWTPALRKAINNAIGVRPVDISPYLFCKRDGTSYYDQSKSKPAQAWENAFSRYIKRVIRETKMEERFTDHDLRAKCASDLESEKHAMELLAHSNVETTRKSYRRKPQIVRPAH